jgi:hypothetical protein
MKVSVEGQYPAGYDTLGFCTDNCSNQFWQKILAYAVEDIGRI